MRSWAEMRTWIEQRLVDATGDDVVTWSARDRDTGSSTEPEVRTWLADQGVAGYPRMILVRERFGYPDDVDDEVVDLLAQAYAANA